MRRQGGRRKEGWGGWPGGELTDEWSEAQRGRSGAGRQEQLASVFGRKRSTRISSKRRRVVPQ